MTTKSLPRPGGRRGRPRSSGPLHCDRCSRGCNKIAVHWPDGALCGICFDTATHTHGTCPSCSVVRMLPGRDEAGRNICVDCAGILARFDYAVCGEERARFRKGVCARCSVRADLAALLTPHDRPVPAAAALLEALVSADRPESIYTWMRHPGVLDVLVGLGAGTLSPDHVALDALPGRRHIAHLRAILVDIGQLPQRDEALARFERWLDEKLDPVSDLTIRKPVERFARWHHLRSIRRRSTPTTSSQAATHNAKQEITAALGLLTWLMEETGRNLANCTQNDVDLWLATGPSTRSTIRTFIVFTVDERLSPRLIVPHRSALSTRRLSSDERLNAIRECLLAADVTIATRTAALLLLLYAQPLVRVCSLRVDAITETDDEMTITFDAQPVIIPALFAEILRSHLADRSRSRTRFAKDSPWLFPGGNAGRHITHSYLLTQIRKLGLNPLATRNRALDDLVTAMPAPVVADLFNYSYQVTRKHAAEAGEAFASYAGSIWKPTASPG